MRLNTYGKVKPKAFSFLNRIAEVTAGLGAAFKRVFIETVMRDISMTLYMCHAVARQVRVMSLHRRRTRMILTDLGMRET